MSQLSSASEVFQVLNDCKATCLTIKKQSDKNLSGNSSKVEV